MGYFYVHLTTLVARAVRQRRSAEVPGTPIGKKHMDYLAEGVARGDIILTGRRPGLDDGFFIVSAPSRARAEEIVHADPFDVEGYTSFELIEIEPLASNKPAIQELLKLPERPPPPAHVKKTETP